MSSCGMGIASGKERPKKRGGKNITKEQNKSMHLRGQFEDLRNTLEQRCLKCTARGCTCSLLTNRGSRRRMESQEERDMSNKIKEEGNLGRFERQKYALKKEICIHLHNPCKPSHQVEPTTDKAKSRMKNITSLRIQESQSTRVMTKVYTNNIIS